MPRPSKKSRAAQRREDARRDKERPERTGEYVPLDSWCAPYWNAFYRNPYASNDEIESIAQELEKSPRMIETWFRRARLFTHMPDRGPETSSDEVMDKELEDTAQTSERQEYIGVDGEIGTLYSYFYQFSHSKSSIGSDRPSHKRAHSQSADQQPQKRQYTTIQSTQGPRGPYTKNSRMTHWRNRKHASDIRSHFPVVARKIPPKPADADIIEIGSSSSSSSEVEAIDFDEPGHVVEPTGQEVASSGLDLGIPLARAFEDTIAGDTDEVEMHTNGSDERLDESLDETSAISEVDLPDISDNSPENPLPGSTFLVMSESEYQKALEALADSLNRLKITMPDQLPENVANALAAPLDDIPEVAAVGIEEGPTPWDIEEQVQGPVRLLDLEDNDCGDTSFYATLSTHLERITKEEKKSKTPNFDRLMLITILSDYNVVREKLRRAGCSAPSTIASEQIAETKAASSVDGDPKTKGKWFARRLRAQAMHVVRFGQLPESTQGKGALHQSLLLDEDVRHRILSYLRSLNMGEVTPTRLMNEVNNTIFPALGITKRISESTALRWIWKLGYKPTSYSKGVYMDGHERSDVVAYRNKFLRKIKALEPFVRQYDDKTAEPLPLILPPGAEEHVFVTHDESCIHANERADTKWLKEGEQQLRQKSRGQLIHVSDFITEKYGRVALTPELIAENRQLPEAERLSKTEARVIIEPGRNRADYWDLKQLCTQIEDTLPIFDRLHPGAVGVFMFDQSSAHAAFGDDALVANRMNVGPGGKNTKRMRDTVIPMDNPHPELRGRSQSMVFPPGHLMHGEPKGMKIILEERGLLEGLDVGKKGEPIGICSNCRKSEAARTKEEKEARERMEENPELYLTIDDAGYEADGIGATNSKSSTCCMRRCLEMQQDFLDEKPKIQVIIESAGHKCMFYPKFHCELNPIEMYWGYAKREFRKRADGKLQTARKLVPECLDSCNITTIRHFWRKSWRYMDAYMKGLTGKQAEFAVKKYKSHRRVGVQVMMDIGLLLN